MLLGLCVQIAENITGSALSNYTAIDDKNTYGILDWSSISELASSQREIEHMRAKYQAKFDAASFSEIMNSPKLLDFAIAGGTSTFQSNCSACHGIGGMVVKVIPI